MNWNHRLADLGLGKVDCGGGGTIAYIMGNLGMDVIDAGVVVQNACTLEVTQGRLVQAYRPTVLEGDRQVMKDTCLSTG